MADGSSLTTASIRLSEDPSTGGLWCGPAPAISGAGLPALKEIGVEVSCRDGKGQLWQSLNQYLVKADGTFDTSETSSVGPGYLGIDAEGPFYSMFCQLGEGHDFAWRESDAISYRIACYDGEEEIFSQEIRRSVGRPAKQAPEPTVRVYLFDNQPEGDGGHAATALRAHGVEVCLGDPRLEPPSELPCAIVASGRSCSQALELAIRCPQVQAVILFSGGGLRFDPFDGGEINPASGSWTPKLLDHIALDHASLQPRAEGILVTRKLYADAVADRANRERGRIEVEKIACPIYLFSGLDDQIWPASAFSELVVQRRKKMGCPFPTYHRTFEGVGHDLGPSLGLPTLPTTERTIAHPDTGFRLLLGGKPGRQARARRECWDTMLRILAGDPPTSP